MRQRNVFGVQKLKQEKQILKQAIENVKGRCIKAKVENKRLEENDMLYGNVVMGYKIRDDSDDDCPYYTMTEMNFVDDVRSIQRNKSIAKIRQHSVTKTSKVIIRQ